MKKRELQYENEQVRVWKTTITPNDPLPPTNDIIIGLNGGSLKHLTAHPGQDPIEAMIVEMKSPSDRPWPSKPID